ncbi:hypothetical protein L6164_000352 [Bauhinia variegata]|uniref:Uncharacterized protein n=1 Tax=Bauhinia variegata TaxID=167791 RepID=A0ACB9Q673_BAUVA|nr:hypothetical protein L6164_000352 [Bauhinia variegata]
MDTLFTPTLILVALVSFLLYLWRIKISDHKNKGIMLAPQVSGALPLIGHLHQLAMAGQTPLARTLAAFADKYGPIFTIYMGAYPVLVVSNKETIKECFTTNDKVLAARPKTYHGVYLGYNFAGFGFAPDGRYWRYIKKLVMLELLSSRRLESLKHVYESEIDSFIKDLYLYVGNKGHDLSNSPREAISMTAGNPDLGTRVPVRVVISKWLEHLTFNIITKLIAGKSYFGNFEDMDDAEARRVGKLMREFMHLTEDYVPSDMIPFLQWFPFEGKVLKSMKRVGRDLDALLGSWVDEHVMKRERNESSDEDEKKDFIDVMLSVVEENPTYGHTRDTIIKATITVCFLSCESWSCIFLAF